MKNIIFLILIIIIFILFFYLNKNILQLYFKMDNLADKYIESFLNSDKYI